MKLYILIVDFNGTVIKQKHRSYDSAMSRASNYRSRGFRAIVKVVENGEILN